MREVSTEQPGGILTAWSWGAQVYGTRWVVVGACTATTNDLRGAEGCAKGMGWVSTLRCASMGTSMHPVREQSCVSPPGKQSLYYV